MGSTTATATAAQFGANGALVAKLLEDAAQPLPAPETSLRRQGLITSLCGIPGEAPSAGEKVRQRIERLVAEARELDWKALVQISSALEERFGGDLAVDVPEGEPREGARRLLLAALVWPAVHGAQPNPFEGAIEMARCGSFAEVGVHRLHQWHRGIEVPAPLGCAREGQPPMLITPFG